jgi:Tfp pilus assembly protein PilN
VQLLDMPGAGPINVGQFVRNEMKSCVALSGQELIVDFCRTTSGQGLKGRLLAVATYGQKAAVLARACHQAGLNIALVEPPLLAYVRALHAKKIAGQFDRNVLIALWRDGALALCVFKDLTLDFVRFRQPPTCETQEHDIGGWLGEEINEIMRFYQMQAADGSGPWDATLLVEDGQLPENGEESLRAQIDCASLRVGTDETFYVETPLVQDSGFQGTSIAAIGLAMKLLGADESHLRINLVPPESAEIRSFKKHCLITANIIAATALLFIVVGAGLSLMAHNVSASVTQRRKAATSQSTYALFEQQELLDREIRQVSDRPARLDSIVGAHPDVDWASILEDIRSRTPKTVRITNLYSRGHTEVHMEGEASKYEAVHMFVKLMNESRYVDSASLVDATREQVSGGLVAYTITCSLVPEKRRDTDGRL